MRLRYSKDATITAFYLIAIVLAITIPTSLGYSSRQLFDRASAGIAIIRISRRPWPNIRMSSSTTTGTTDAATQDPLERFGLPGPLLLGSASFTRKLILKEMGVNYHKLVRPIDEKALGDRSQDAPSDLVLTLAKAKMDHLVTEIQSGRCQEELPSKDQTDWVVLTGDQVVTCQGNILEKPESIEEAKEFVAQYGHSPPSTVGSCVLTHLPSGIQVSGVDTATIYFKPTIPTELIDRLVALDEPVLSCAGGLMIEHPLTKEHLDRIDGTEDSVMGLSKDLVLRLMEELSQKIQAREEK